MDECLEILGNAVRRARKQMKLSQEKLAELLDVDYKTINFIENHKGNPTFEIVYQLIRVLKLDAREIFNYDQICKAPTAHHLQQLLNDCSEDDALILMDVCQSILKGIKKEREKKKYSG